MSEIAELLAIRDRLRRELKEVGQKLTVARLGHVLTDPELNNNLYKAIVIGWSDLRLTAQRVNLPTQTVKARLIREFRKRYPMIRPSSLNPPNCHPFAGRTDPTIGQMRLVEYQGSWSELVSNMPEGWSRMCKDKFLRKVEMALTADRRHSAATTPIQS